MGETDAAKTREEAAAAKKSKEEVAGQYVEGAQGATAIAAALPFSGADVVGTLGPAGAPPAGGGASPFVATGLGVFERHSGSTAHVNAPSAVALGSRGVFSAGGGFGGTSHFSAASPFVRATSPFGVAAGVGSSTGLGAISPGQATGLGQATALGSTEAIAIGAAAGPVGSAAAVGNGDGCDSAAGSAALTDADPSDSTVQHVAGSACCAANPLPAPTDRYGCCRRCLGSTACEVFVWQPSSGTCWLMRWVGPQRSTKPTRDRITGEKPGLSFVTAARPGAAIAGAKPVEPLLAAYGAAKVQ